MNPIQTYDLPLPQGDAAPGGHRRGAHRSRRLLLGIADARTRRRHLAARRRRSRPRRCDLHGGQERRSRSGDRDGLHGRPRRLLVARGDHRCQRCGGSDEILLPPATYTLTRAGYSEDAGSTGDLDITDDVTITGRRGTSAVVAGGPAPLRRPDLQPSPGAIAAITGITITGGKLSGTDAGGGIRSYGDLTLDRVAVKGNTVSTAPQAEASTARARSASRTAPSPATRPTVRRGLALYNSTATITSSTISGNQAGQFAGGVLAVTAAVSIKNSTIASNRSGGLGGGIKSASERGCRQEHDRRRQRCHKL